MMGMIWEDRIDGSRAAAVDSGGDDGRKVMHQVITK